MCVKIYDKLCRLNIKQKLCESVITNLCCKSAQLCCKLIIICHKIIIDNVYMDWISLYLPNFYVILWSESLLVMLMTMVICGWKYLRFIIKIKEKHFINPNLSNLKFAKFQ